MAKKIAQVIPLTRLKRDLHFFDYLVPEDLNKRVKKGQLVEIPFRNKNIKGIIFNLSKSSEFEDKNLKSLNKIIDPLPFLMKWQLKLIEDLAEYYFVSFSVFAKMIVPEIPQKPRKSKIKFLEGIEFFKSPKLEIKVNFYSQGKNPALLRIYNFENKIKSYLALIKKIIAKDKQIVIIVPQLADIKKIYQYLLEYKNITSVFLNDLPKNKYWQEWLKIKKGQAKIIIGTRSAIFAPFNNLDTIIIDQEENENHKQEEPNPRYHVKKVVLKLKELLKAKLFFVSATPSLNSLYKVQQKEWQYFEVNKLRNNPQVKIIDRQDEFKKGNYSIFSELLLNRIEYNLKRAKKIFLFLNRKGLATLATCKDCGYIAVCPHCDLPLTLHANKQLICHHCGHKQDVFLFCPKCRSSEIKLTGTGTEKVEIEIKKHFPQSQILKIDQESPSEKEIDKYDIIIGTQYAFNFIDWRLISLTGVINADTLFYLPDYKSMEKTFNLLNKLAIFLANNKKEIIVQTFTPENYIFEAFKKFDYKSFYINELRERKAFNYPPLTKLIKIIYQSIEFNGGQKEINEVYKNLKLKVKNDKIIINPPLLAHTQQVRGRFRWQIIVKALDKDMKLDFLRELPENIIIDVDPESLL